MNPEVVFWKPDEDLPPFPYMISKVHELYITDLRIVNETISRYNASEGKDPWVERELHFVVSNFYKKYLHKLGD